MGARDNDPVEIATASGILLLGLPQDSGLANLGRIDTSALIPRLQQSRLALANPVVNVSLRRLAARAHLQIPAGLDANEALVAAISTALAHKIIIGVFLPRAPVGATVAAPAPKPAPPSGGGFAGMSAEQRVRLLLERTPQELGPDLKRAFLSMITVEALAGIAAAFVVLLAAQFVGVGELADAALAWWAYSQAGFAGLTGLYKVLRAIVSAVRAENEGEFNQAVKRFAEGLTLVGVALLTVVVARAARKRAGGGSGDTSSGFGRAAPEPASQRWPIAPAAKSEAVDLKRPYIRQSVRADVEAAAPRTTDGRPIDPNTGQPIDGTPDLGHKPGNEFWREKQSAETEGLTQQQFNDRMNDPDKYQLEDPSSNRSHKYEQP
jgi:hypothetical protein